MLLKNKIKAISLATALAFSANSADITVAYDTAPASLDPMEQLSLYTSQMSHLIFDPLVRTDSKLKYQPRLAESWKQTSPTITRFNLRKDVKFHSGNAMTADDVVWSFNRLKKSHDFKGIFDIYSEMIKVDDYTVELIAKKPYPLVLANATYLFVMDSKFYTGKTAENKDKSAIKKGSSSFASNNVSGTGPFKVKLREQDVKLELLKNEDYWGTTGNIENLTWLIVKDHEKRLAALFAGDVDMISRIPPPDLSSVNDHENTNLLTMTSDRIISLQLNQKIVPEFKDKRVREAIAYAINNTHIAKRMLRGFVTPAAQNSPKGYAGHVKEFKPRYNLERAKELMKEAGLEKGFTTAMLAPKESNADDDKIVQSIVEMLKKINITVNLTTIPKAQYWSDYNKCENGIQLMGWSSDTGDSANYSEYLTVTRNEKTGRGQYNCGYYSNTTLDALISDANTEMDPYRRALILQQITQIEYDDVAYIPLYWPKLSWGTNKKITNLADSVNLKNFPLFGDIVIKEVKK